MVDLNQTCFIATLGPEDRCSFIISMDISFADPPPHFIPTRHGNGLLLSNHWVDLNKILNLSSGDYKETDKGLDRR